MNPLAETTKPRRFEGSYELRITVTGHEGSAASAALSAEGNLAQPARGE